ncbi:hypothetical protein RQP46_001376 [Phenoliferia psychrophenolica]
MAPKSDPADSRPTSGPQKSISSAGPQRYPTHLASSRKAPEISQPQWLRARSGSESTGAAPSAASAASQVIPQGGFGAVHTRSRQRSRSESTGSSTSTEAVVDVLSPRKKTPGAGRGVKQEPRDDEISDDDDDVDGVLVEPPTEEEMMDGPVEHLEQPTRVRNKKKLPAAAASTTSSSSKRSPAADPALPPSSPPLRNENHPPPIPPRTYKATQRSVSGPSSQPRPTTTTDDATTPNDVGTPSPLLDASRIASQVTASFTSSITSMLGQNSAQKAEEKREARARHEAEKRDKRTLNAFDDMRHEYGELNAAQYFFDMGDNRDGLRGQVHELKCALRDIEVSEQGLGRELQQQEKKILDLEHRLVTSRAFVESADAGDARSVIDHLERISTLVDDTAFNLAESIAGSHGEDPLTDEHLTALATSLSVFESPRAKFLLQLALEVRNKDGSISDYLIYAIATSLAFGIQVAVFDKFHPALDEEENALLSQLYDQIRETEPQDRSARWRSITYTRVSSPTSSSLASSITSSLITTLHQITDAVLPFTASNNVKKNEGEIEKLVVQALQWHDKTRRDFLSCDFLPTVNFDVKDGNVIAVQGFGLVQRRGVVGEGGTVKILTEELVKVPTVLKESL